MCLPERPESLLHGVMLFQITNHDALANSDEMGRLISACGLCRKLGAVSRSRELAAVLLERVIETSPVALE